MKKVLITVALFALLGTVTVSCQKEAEPVTSSVCSQAEYNVRYSIDNRIYHANLQSSEEWHTFLSDMLALSRKHHPYPGNTTVSAFTDSIITGQ